MKDLPLDRWGGGGLTLTMTSMAWRFSFLLSPKDLILKEQSFRARELCRQRRKSSKAAELVLSNILALLWPPGLCRLCWALTYEACR